MCSGSRRKVVPDDLAMEGGIQGQEILLELSANDDLRGFRTAVEEEGLDVNMSGLWYGRRIGSKKMGYEERTPLMVASTFGSKQVLNYILEKGCAEINRACGSDGATALHCAVAGGSTASLDVIKLLLGYSADENLVDANGNRAADLIPFCRFSSRKKMLEHVLKGGGDADEGYELIDEGAFEKVEEQRVIYPNVLKDGSERKEYPVDPSLPDIKNGIYGTDDFRMYTFKVKPCSRAYSHDWTECPFVHPGENARRRDPRKYHYSCVPCPDFRKGTCQRGDACEYSHGIFECWLHPAQYRTRMCKDESRCNRRVCFFAHKPEELRPFYASTGSALPSPRSYSLGASSLDIASISPLALGSPSIMVPPTSTSPVTPSGASSPRSGSPRPNQPNMTTPTLQLHGSRLKTALNARDMDLDFGLLGLDHLRQEQMVDDMSALSSPSSWNKISATTAAFGASSSGEFSRHAGLMPTNLDDIFGAFDPNVLSQLQGLSLDTGKSQLQSPKGMQIRQNMSQNFLSSFPASPSTSSFRMDPSDSASAVLKNSRSSAFAKRSQSFVDRSAVKHGVASSPTSSAIAMPSTFSGWGSPDGKLDWGIKKEELSKLRKSASFGIRSSGNSVAMDGTSFSTTVDEPNALWVQSLVNVAPPINHGQFSMEDQQYCLNNRGGSEMHPAWADQLYMDQEQVVA
ncbi:zinc finger CCCH domain-containing protein 66-like [Ipomoea triloba]|uniref:zinc finger CCCH domain-containing protein 66-like n=1 Tax=Ipomoea triloba TaxID=35885 RepID=UPI00125E5001|nr:zinc finger CCCH domain-containing protein 66-like [Ipomoea triloba]XP_031110774.1 zinc finger CCCH domain-containing protein 66-like [Ipomoea triloba]